MKVYVDELPKDCIGCPCESEYYCNLLKEDNGEEFIDWWTSSLPIDDWKHLHDLKEKQIKMF